MTPFVNLRVISLLYHDVIEGNAADASGFPGGAAAVYKLERGRFTDHLAAIAAAIPNPPTTVRSVLAGNCPATPRMLTFDDGGASAFSPVADLLEQLGWRGHFFVTANRIGTAGFLTRDQVRSLHERGHIVGSHSWSHPDRMTTCSDERLFEEWDSSVRLLTEIIGDRVETASVPCGAYGRRVAHAAARAGIRALFTSEPSVRCRTVAGCLILGRFTMRRRAPAELAARIAADRGSSRLRQWVPWQIKKLLKRLAWQPYQMARTLILERPGPSS